MRLETDLQSKYAKFGDQQQNDLGESTRIREGYKDGFEEGYGQEGEEGVITLGSVLRIEGTERSEISRWGEGVKLVRVLQPSCGSENKVRWIDEECEESDECDDG
jgi:hypothetical protein